MKLVRTTLLATLLSLAVVAPPAFAGVDVVIDKSTLNDMLGALAVQQFSMPLSETRSITVRLDNLRVTGLDPAKAGAPVPGYLLTSLQLVVPEFGLVLPVSPRLSLRAVRMGQSSLLELRFDEVVLNLPLAGSFNVASMMPPLRFPAENLWLVDGGASTARVRSKLRDIHMDAETILFRFEVEVEPVSSDEVAPPTGEAP